MVKPLSSARERRGRAIEAGVFATDTGRQQIETRRHIGHTHSMKTAVSVPDEVFREAEAHAERTRKSRSQLYSEALAEYLARHSPNAVTRAMNEVVDAVDPASDRFVSAATRHTLERVEW